MLSSRRVKDKQQQLFHKVDARHHKHQQQKHFKI
jgi:hypothetical protein